MKLPNGFGSISKMSGKRRNPFRVRITVGWKYDETKEKMVQQYKTVGYYKTKTEAINALLEYHKCPYDLESKDITFKELYELWSEQYFQKLSKESSRRTVISAFSYSSDLYDKKMREIRSYHLKSCIDNGYVIPTTGKDKGKKRFATANTKSRMKSLYNLMFDYAMEHEIVDKNYARLFKLDDEIVQQKKNDKKQTIPFTNKELEILWEQFKHIPFADMVLIQIYSGWRPQELSILKLEDINLEEGLMRGGLKTEAGKNRIVPIHPLVHELVANRYSEAKALGSLYLFNDLDGQQGTIMTYDKYRRRFDKVMERLKMKHRPHEARHTFISLAKDYNLNEHIIKLVVGHATEDVTEKTYTHRTVSQLQEEMKKIGQYRTTQEDYYINW